MDIKTDSMVYGHKNRFYGLWALKQILMGYGHKTNETSVLLVGQGMGEEVEEVGG